MKYSSNRNLLTNCEFFSKCNVSFIFFTAFFWLLLAIFFGIIYSIKSFYPSFLDFNLSTSFIENGLSLYFSTGVVYNVFINILIYGWGFLSGFSILIWLTEKLSEKKINRPFGLIVITLIWNLTLVIGVISLFTGHSNNIGLNWTSMPDFTLIIFFMSSSYIAVKMICTLLKSDSSFDHISKKYILGLCLFLSWSILSFYLFKECFSATPVMITIMSAWYKNIIIHIWFVSLTLAIIYYLISEITGQSIYNNKLAKFGFWSLIVIAPWSGLYQYFGTPVPNWIMAVSSISTILLIIPTSIVSINILTTVKNDTSKISSNTINKFLFTSLYFYIAAVLLQVFATLNNFIPVLGLTSFIHGVDICCIFGSFTFAIFGAFYYMIPEISNSETYKNYWKSKKINTLSYNHFWILFYGITSLIVTNLSKGFMMGNILNIYDTKFSVASTISIGFSIGEFISWIIILIGIVLFISILINSMRLSKKNN